MSEKPASGEVSKRQRPASEARLYRSRTGVPKSHRRAAFPFTRGIHKDMYRGRLWTMRQYAGFGTAAESNKRYKFLLKQGQTGLSVAFDLPTQIGYDSDDPMANGEVGKVGVAIDSLEDMEILLDGHPAGKGLDVDDDQRHGVDAAPAVPAGGREAGLPAREDHRHRAERHPQGVRGARHLHLSAQALDAPDHRPVCVLPGDCRTGTRSRSRGYHMREAGSTAAEEIALTLGHAIAYVEAAQAAGLEVDDFAPRFSFFFAWHMDFFEEVAKFRAARRMWARIMRDRSTAIRPSLPRPALSHADGRSDTHRPAAVDQHRPHGVGGDERGPWGHPIAAHQRL